MNHSRACPKCLMSLLEPVSDHGVGVGACLGCGGLWFDSGELAKVIRHYDPKGVSGERVADGLGPSRGKTRFACPACSGGLNEHQLSNANALWVDVCGDCGGVWLDHEEFDQAVAGRAAAEAKENIEADTKWGGWVLQFLTGLPTEFNITPRRGAAVTYSLVVLNCLVFLAGLVLRPEGWLTIQLALYPGELGSGGWFVGLITSQFAHADVFHLLGNMYFLWILGDNVEDVLGRWRYLLFYLGAGVCGGVVYSLFAGVEMVPAVGASGAISGLLGFYAVLFSRSKLTFMLVVWQFKMPARAWVGIWLLFNLFGWLVRSPGVAWEAHVGGLVFGLLVAGVCYRWLMRGNPVLRLLRMS